MASSSGSPTVHPVDTPHIDRDQLADTVMRSGIMGIAGKHVESLHVNASYWFDHRKTHQPRTGELGPKDA